MNDRPDPLEVLEQPPTEAAPPPEAPIEEVSPPVPPAPPAPGPDVQTIDGIPVAKYMALRDKERQTQAEIQHLRQQLQRYSQPPQELPDPLTDPRGYENYIAQQIDQRLAQSRREFDEYRYADSEERAADRYGRELVEEAFAAFQQANMQDPSMWHRFHASRDPWGQMVNWYNQAKLMSQIGDDPDAWVERRFAEIQAAKAAQAQARGSSPPPAPGTPFRGGPRRAPVSSLSNAPPSGVRTQAVATGPSATFDSMFKP